MIIISERYANYSDVGEQIFRTYDFPLMNPLHLSPIIYAHLPDVLIKSGEGGGLGGKKGSRKVVKAWTFNNVRRGAISPLVCTLSVGVRN